MQSALERRQAIVDVISDRRFETLDNLSAEFGVTRRTIQNDITVISCSAPIFTVQGNGGGIRAADGWYSNRRYLQKAQEEALEAVLNGLQPDMKVIQSILDSFAKPKVKEPKN